MGWVRTHGGFEFQSDDPRAPRAWIEASPDRSRHVVMENHGEHHVGAESVVIVPDRAVAGVTRFHTTNGQARFDPNGRWLIIEGVVGFVAVNLADGSVAHYEPEVGSLIGTWSISGGVVEWKQVRQGSATSEVKSCPLDEIRARWQPGLGPFANGIFQPDQKFVKKWDKWVAGGGRAKAMLPLPELDVQEEGAFTVDGNRSAGLLAFGVIIVSAVVAGLVIGWLSRGGIGSDMLNLFLALLAMIGLAPGLVVAEGLVRHPVWIHFGSDVIHIKQVLGSRRRNARRITDIRSVQYDGSSIGLPAHVMVIYFRDEKPLRIDSDMVEKRGLRDMSSMEQVERRVRALYEQPGTWTATHRRNPELVELTRSAR